MQASLGFCTIFDLQGIFSIWPSLIPKFSTSGPTLASYLDDYNKPENSTSTIHPIGLIEYELAPSKPLPRGVHTTCEEIGYLIGDVVYKCKIFS